MIGEGDIRKPNEDQRNCLNESAVRQAFSRRGLAIPETFSLCCFEEVDSSNLVIKRAIGEGKPEWTVCSALIQNGGYGRQGRTWTSPLGGLYLSILLRPQEHEEFSADLPTLSLVLSLAVQRALAQLGAEGVLIKWPNDLVHVDHVSQGHQGGKVAGVSVEAVNRGICVGIGINLFHPVQQAEAKDNETDVNATKGKYAPVYAIDLFHNKTPEPIEAKVAPEGLSDLQSRYMEDAFCVLIHEVERVYNEWLVDGFSLFKDEYQAKFSLQGQAVILVNLTNDIVYKGIVCGVDTEGFLCLLDENGVTVRAHSGEVHLI